MFISKPIISVAMLVLVGPVALTTTSPKRPSEEADAPPPTASLDAKSAWFSRAVGNTLAEAASPTGGDHDSPFEAAVMAGLQAKGWIVHPQVGVSGFRNDLGVVHPDEPGRYLTGVECDGATYHRSATATGCAGWCSSTSAGALGGFGAPNGGPMPQRRVIGK